MLLSILISLFFIPGLVLLYFCFLMSIMLLKNGGVAEGALVEVFMIRQRKRLLKIYLKFLSGGIICISLPILWFCYI